MEKSEKTSQSPPGSAIPGAIGERLASIIVPTCNRTADLRKCLEILTRLLPGDDSVDIHVCDDGSDPATPEMVRRDFPHAEWHQGPRRGPAANRNFGARVATGKWLLFIDDDCLPRPAILQSYLTEMKKTDDPHEVLYGPTFRMGELSSLVWEAPHNPTGEQVISCNFAILKHFFAEAGCFDERFPIAAFEDTELEGRLRLLGAKILFLPEAAVDHPLRPLPSPFKLARRWEARVITTHDLGARPFEILWKLPRHIAAIIVSRLRGRRPTGDNLRAAWAYVGEFLWVMWQLPRWLFRHCRQPRSPFWVEQVNLGHGPRRFGL